jgi:hypothetical protein
LFALTLAMMMRLLFTHTFYGKDFTTVTGLLVAARLWIWPSGTTLSAARLARKAGQLPRNAFSK